MLKLKLTNVRCFADPAPVRIAPLTILVGENSTGKSSFLALQRATLDLIGGQGDVNFNKDPFFLGAYDQIAHYRGGRGGRADFFEIGIRNTVKDPGKTKRKPNNLEANYTARFVKRGSQPELSHINFRCGRHAIEIAFNHDQVPSIKINTPSWSGTIPEQVWRYIPVSPRFLLGEATGYFYLLREIARRERIKNFSLSKEDALVLSGYWNSALEPFFISSFSIAPVRTKPERTYDPIDDTPRSAGSHVPMLLAKTRFTDRERWEAVKNTIDRFGQKSGLFKEISLKTLGHSDSDPFQIMIKIFGPRSNLIDVGYGVSQVLPIVTDIIMEDRARFYLLQQPEVHLHPRAQAELASFFGEIVTNTKSKIMVETHSDYIIDRIRMDVRDKKRLKPEDVSILFFERTGRDVEIHSIGLDKQGNLLNVPKSYRSFFLTEEARFFGLS